MRCCAVLCCAVLCCAVSDGTERWVCTGSGKHFRPLSEPWFGARAASCHHPLAPVAERRAEIGPTLQTSNWGWRRNSQLSLQHVCEDVQLCFRPRGDRTAAITDKMVLSTIFPNQLTQTDMLLQVFILGVNFNENKLVKVRQPPTIP